MLTAEQFLAKIETHLSESGIKASRFGKEALGDPSFVFELRKGRQPNLLIVNRVLSFMERRDAEHDPVAGAAA